jgi:hypothetical protein
MDTGVTGLHAGRKNSYSNVGKTTNIAKMQK